LFVRLPTYSCNTGDWSKQSNSQRIVKNPTVTFRLAPCHWWSISHRLRRVASAEGSDDILRPALYVLASIIAYFMSSISLSLCIIDVAHRLFRRYLFCISNWMQWTTVRLRPIVSFCRYIQQYFREIYWIYSYLFDRRRSVTKWLFSEHIRSSVHLYNYSYIYFFQFIHVFICIRVVVNIFVFFFWLNS